MNKVLNNLPAYIAYTRKAIINVSGLVISLLALGLLPSQYAGLTATITGVATVLLHFFTENAPKPVIADPDVDAPI